MNSLAKHISNALLLCLGLLLILGQLQRWQITPSVAVYGHDLVIICLLCIWWKRMVPLRTARHLTTWMQQQPLVLLLVCLIILNGIIATLLTHTFSHWLYLARLLVYTVFSWGLVSYAKKVQLISLSLSASWIYPIMGLGVAYVGFLQYLLLPDTRFLFVLGWDDHYFRLISTQLDPAFTGAILMLGFFSLEHWFKGVWLHALRLVIVIAISLTFSRATFLSVAIGVAVYAFLSWCRHQPRWQILLFVPVMLVSLWLAPKPTGEGVNLIRTSTIEARATANQAWASHMRPWQWIIGRGLFVSSETNDSRETTDAYYDHANVADTLPLLLLTGLGVVGCVLLICLIWQWRSRYETAPIWLIAAFLAVLTHSLFNNTIFQPFVWLLLTGLVFVGRLTGQSQPVSTGLK